MTEWRFPEEQFRYPLVPRKHPRTPPTSGVFDTPYRCLKVNADWWSHVSGMIAVLADPDAWLGTPEEVDAAILQINLLLSAGIEECEVAGITAIRYQMTEDPAQRLQYLIDGEWVDVTGWPILESRFDDIDTITGIHNDKITALEALTLDHDNRLEVIETAGLWDETRISNIEAKDVEQDGRLDVLEDTVNEDLAPRLVDIENILYDGAEQGLVSKFNALSSDVESNYTEFSELLAAWDRQKFWDYDFDFVATNPSDLGWTVHSGSWASGGVTFTGGSGVRLNMTHEANLRDATVEYCNLWVSWVSGGANEDAVFQWADNSGVQVWRMNASGTANWWMKIPSLLQSDHPQIIIEDIPTSGTFKLIRAYFVGRGGGVW